MKKEPHKEWKFSKIEEDTYLIHSHKSSVHVFLLKGTKASLLIDTGCGGTNLRAFVESLVNTPIMVVNTHGHYDHIGCNKEFDEVYIHKDDMDTLAYHSDAQHLKTIISKINPTFMTWYYQWTRPNMFRPSICKNMIEIKEGQMFDLGNRSLCVLHTPGHSKGSIALYEEQRKQLFVGDTICHKLVLLGMEFSCPVHVYLNSLKKLNEMLPEDSIFYPNHHELPVTKDLLKDYIHCAQQIVQSPLSYQVKKFAGTQIIFQEYKQARLTYDIHQI